MTPTVYARRNPPPAKKQQKRTSIMGDRLFRHKSAMLNRVKVTFEAMYSRNVWIRLLLHGRSTEVNDWPKGSFLRSSFCEQLNKATLNFFLRSSWLSIRGRYTLVNRFTSDLTFKYIRFTFNKENTGLSVHVLVTQINWWGKYMKLRPTNAFYFVTFL